MLPESTSIYALSTSKDSRFLYSCASDNNIYVWDIRTEKLITYAIFILINFLFNIYIYIYIYYFEKKNKIKNKTKTKNKKLYIIHNTIIITFII